MTGAPRAARRYRLVLLAFPRAERDFHGREVLGVLEQTDRDRGSASWCEAGHLVLAGAALRTMRVATVFTRVRVIGLAAAMAVLAAFAPGTAWAVRPAFGGHGHGYDVIQGPTPALRWALLVAASIAFAATVAQDGVRARYTASVAAGGTGVILGLSVAVRAPGALPGLPAAAEAALLRGGGLTVGVVVVSLVLARLPALYRVRCAAVCMVLACVGALIGAVQAIPASNLGTLALWHLGPAGILTVATATLGCVAMLANQGWDDHARLRPVTKL